MSYQSSLTVRQHERSAVQLIVEFVVADGHREQVRFSGNSTATEPHVVRCTAVDISPGGMGLLCEEFIPRNCEGLVFVFDPSTASTSAGRTTTYEVIFEHRVRVRRVRLATHEPMYELGVAFVEAEPNIDERVMKLLTTVLDPSFGLTLKKGEGDA